MNKKRLSVVMAGAMLATSVAPVLAAEVVKSEASAAELGLLIQKVREKLNSAKFADETAEDREINGALAGKSIYEVKIDNRVVALDADSSQDEYQRLLGSLKVGTKVEIWTRGYKEVKDGEATKYYAREAKDAAKYTAEDFATNTTASNIQKAIRNITALNQTVVSVKTLQNDEKVIEVEFKKTGLSGAESTVIGSGRTEKAKLTIAEGDVKYDFTHYIDNTTGDKLTVKATTANTDIRDFARVAASYTDITDVEKVEEITITPGGYDLALEDLYDGLMLTEKGHDFFTMLKEANSIRRPYVVTGNKGNISRTATKSEVAGAIGKDAKGNYVFTVTLPEFKLEGSDDRKLSKEVYTITAKNEKDAERVAYWMLKPLARVDILAGDNRYETAVKISKEYAGLTGETVSNFDNNDTKGVNIVLVNGNALVDGLSAAPLAATLTNKVGDANHKAPVLLTEADALPKATKAYLKEVIANVKVGRLNDVTIHLVGGESVLNKSLERELFHLGFKVERYGGDNREETSLEVAKEVEKTNTKNERFVVGADGEADAMSIAAVAAYNKTPIIVAKRGGISEDALHTFDEKANVAIVGGETVVTEAEENGLKSVSKAVIRLGGENRKATNAKIIETYYKRSALDSNSGFVGEAVGNGRTNHVIVAKDGQRKKTELVDALAAANFASEIKAPIVLATDKLSKAQISALELNSKTSTALYQVGIGVARDVVKTIAEGLNLTNSNRY